MPDFLGGFRRGSQMLWGGTVFRDSPQARYYSSPGDSGRLDRSSLPMPLLDTRCRFRPTRKAYPVPASAIPATQHRGTKAVYLLSLTSVWVKHHGDWSCRCVPTAFLLPAACDDSTEQAAGLRGRPNRRADEFRETRTDPPRSTSPVPFTACSNSFAVSLEHQIT